MYVILEDFENEPHFLGKINPAYRDKTGQEQLEGIEYIYIIELIINDFEYRSFKMCFT